MAIYKPRRLRNETEPEQVREPSLYRSLCTSLLSTLLSLVMLVGTTFAWFTESITTGVYTITAGNLSTVTSYCTDLTTPNWQPLNESNTTLFGGMTFSNPDTTQTAYLKLENKSSSPVKYLISFLCSNEKPGTLENSVGTTTTTSEGKLSELMSFAYTVASDTNPGGTIPSFDPSTGPSIPLGKSAASPFSILVQGGSTVYVKLDLTLNYEGTWTVEPKIDLQLKLVITQPDNNDLEDGSSTTSQALQAGTPVTVGEAETSEGATLTVGVTIENAPESSPAGEPAGETVVEPITKPSTETATAPAAEGTNSAETAQELSSAPETTE